MMRKWTLGLLPLCFSVGVLPVSPAARNEVISSVEHVKEVFGATAVMHDDKLEFTLRPSPEWLRFGKFVFYTLRISPAPIKDLKHGDTRLKAKTIVEKNESRIAKFEVAEKDVQKSYVVVHFQSGKLRDDGPMAVLIPLSLLKEVAERRQNPNPKASEPPSSGGVAGKGGP